MDRMVNTIMNSMQTVQDLQAISANNLANMNVPGFRRDLPASAESVSLEGEGFSARMFQGEAQYGSFSTDVGQMQQTGDPFDVAIIEDGYFFVQEGNGAVGLTRRGDLRTDGAGQLVNGGGELVLDTNLAPIVLPPYRSMQITEVGQIVIEPLDAAPGEKVAVGTIGTVVPDLNATLVKGLDGLIRNLDGSTPQPNQLASVRQGVLEGANVNATEELITSITIQRSFEMNMRMINTAKELDEAGTEIMQAPA